MGGSNCDRNFYPRSPCGERHTKHFPALHHILISIHALLAESDAGAGNNAIGISYFYPRSPCGERPECRVTDCSRSGISIHALLAESDLTSVVSSTGTTGISIHALLAESDFSANALPITSPIFLSTLSLRRATGLGVGVYLATEISIHALLAESDPLCDAGDCATAYFYPRSPCGERPFLFFVALKGQVFLSTLSLRRATTVTPMQAPPYNYFYPRSPCGERQRCEYQPTKYG